MAKEPKKSSKKKTTPAKSPAKVRLTAEDLEHFKHLLLEKRAEIIGDVNSMENEALKKSRLDAAGDLSSMPIHMADIGTDNYEQEFALGLLDSERKLLHEINSALLRIEEGTYGVCEGTGDPIPKARLEANPWARYCVVYANNLEKGLVQEPRQSIEERKTKSKKTRGHKEDEEEIETQDEKELEEQPEDEEEEAEAQQEEVEFEEFKQPDEDEDEEDEDQESKYF